MQEGVEAQGRDWALLARAVLAGAVVAAALFYALLFGGLTAYRASELAFSLAALVFALGLTAWSGVIMSGEALEGFSRQFGISDTWTAESGRQAMAFLIAFGGGGMVGTVLAAMPHGV
jgi:formate/nitrite transporter FocA (FNT family)